MGVSLAWTDAAIRLAVVLVRDPDHAAAGRECRMTGRGASDSHILAVDLQTGSCWEWEAWLGAAGPDLALGFRDGQLVRWLLPFTPQPLAVDPTWSEWGWSSDALPVAALPAAGTLLVAIAGAPGLGSGLVQVDPRTGEAVERWDLEGLLVKVIAGPFIKPCPAARCQHDRTLVQAVLGDPSEVGRLIEPLRTDPAWALHIRSPGDAVDGVTVFACEESHLSLRFSPPDDGGVVPATPTLDYQTRMYGMPPPSARCAAGFLEDEECGLAVVREWLREESAEVLGLPRRVRRWECGVYAGHGEVELWSVRRRDGSRRVLFVDVDESRVVGQTDALGEDPHRWTVVSSGSGCVGLVESDPSDEREAPLGAGLPEGRLCFAYGDVGPCVTATTEGCVQGLLVAVPSGESRQLPFFPQAVGPGCRALLSLGETMGQPPGSDSRWWVLDDGFD
jgi:hypothetical protein